MKEDIFTFQYIVTDEYFDRINFTKEELEREVKGYMFQALAKELAEQIEITKERWKGYSTMYTARVALLTPEKYRHLLDCERKLIGLYDKLDNL